MEFCQSEKVGTLNGFIKSDKAKIYAVQYACEMIIPCKALRQEGRR